MVKFSLPFLIISWLSLWKLRVKSLHLAAEGTSTLTELIIEYIFKKHLLCL